MGREDKMLTFSLLDSGTKPQAESVDIANTVATISQKMLSATSHAQLEEVLRQCEYFELRGYELMLSPEQQQSVLVSSSPLTSLMSLEKIATLIIIYLSRSIANFQFILRRKTACGSATKYCKAY